MNIRITNVIKVFAYLALFFCHGKSVSGYRCMQCDSVPLPNLCEQVGECGQHELCSLEQYITPAGVIHYKQSCQDERMCRSTDTSKRQLLCSECCHGDLCNAAGCGNAGLDYSLGAVCYSCPLQIGTFTCDKIKQCGRDQICAIFHVQRTGAPDNLYETRCAEPQTCADHDMAPLVGRRRAVCSSCCNSTMCNNYDPRICHTTTTVKTTTSPTTEPAMIATTSTTKTAATDTITATQPTSVQFTTSAVQTSSVVQTDTLTPAISEVCVDKAVCYPSMCQILNPYVRENCTKTCLCEHTTVSVAHTDSPLCNDFYNGCEVFFHICSIPEYANWAHENCKKSCKVC